MSNTESTPRVRSRGRLLRWAIIGLVAAAPIVVGPYAYLEYANERELQEARAQWARTRCEMAKGSSPIERPTFSAARHDRTAPSESPSCKRRVWLCRTPPLPRGLERRPDRHPGVARALR